MMRHQGLTRRFAWCEPQVLSTVGLFLPLLLLAGGADLAASEELGKKGVPRNDGIEILINMLPEAIGNDFGYMAAISGSAFLPLGTSQIDTILLGREPPVSSGILDKLVKRGAAAVPHLIAHLDDKRTTKIAFTHELGFGGTLYSDEYDYNVRTSRRPREGVNRFAFDDVNRPQSHTVTVGDLCFVALGQIVNRRFNAVRYQPTACIMINSPTTSEALRKTIKKEWGDLTPGRHKESLARDFLEPDDENRRIGACLRLGYYYADALEPLALKQLAAPRYNVSEVGTLVHKLYQAKDARERKEWFDAFVAKHGEVARQGCLVDLFDDLDTQEADEEGRLSPPLKESYAARACLVELYGYPKGVKSKDRPHLVPTDDAIQARFIDAVAFFPSAKLDQAVRAILHSTDDDYLATACQRYLVGRGADPDIRRYVEQHRKQADERRKKVLREMLDRLSWTRLHAAAEAGNPALAEILILQGADINARAANGQTPLHVAAAHGNDDVINALAKHKANLNLKDQLGRTAVQVGLDHAPAVEKLLAVGAEPSDILVASFAGRADLVKDFLARDKNAVMATTPEGETALHLAARLGHGKVAEVLLANGADVNARDAKEFTPLHSAALDGRSEVVALLLAHKADSTAKSWNGKTPLDFARTRGDAQTIRMLEKKP
jgi:ankyrin repeat protein